jgi:hypothetical protein
MTVLSRDELRRRREREQANRLLALGENWEVGDGAPGESAMTFSDTRWVPPRMEAEKEIPNAEPC